jgi:hypothetical protein
MDSKPAPVVPAPPSKPFGLISWVCIVVGVLLSLSTARVWAHGEWTGEAEGYAFGSLLIPGLIAYLIAGRRKVRNPAAFGLCFLRIMPVVFPA